jgi:hypothetical protein
MLGLVLKLAGDTCSGRAGNRRLHLRVPRAGVVGDSRVWQDQMPKKWIAAQLGLATTAGSGCRTGGFVAHYFDLILGLHRPGKVVVHLHPQPRIRSAAESLFQPDGHFRRNRRLAIEKVIQSLAAHPENFGSGSHSKAERYQAIEPDNLSRVHRILHRHGYSPFLMVVNQVDFISLAIFKTKDDAPVGANGHGPVSLVIALKRMQMIAGEIESLRGGSGVQHSQNAFDFVDQVSTKAAAIVLLEQPLKTLVLEADDH